MVRRLASSGPVARQAELQTLRSGAACARRHTEKSIAVGMNEHPNRVGGHGAQGVDIAWSELKGLCAQGDLDAPGRNHLLKSFESDLHSQELRDGFVSVRLA